MLEAKDVAFAVNGKVLLDKVSLSFTPGKICALVGHNGSGKSTLIKLLAQQQATSSGQIALDQKPLSKWSEKAFAREVAYLPQHLPATDNLTGYELVSFGRYPWHGLLGRLTKADHQAINEAMALTGTQGYAERLVDTLSGGERQRLWIAMLLAQQTRYLLLDEPLSALDVAHQVEVMTLVRKLSRELDKSIIIVVHDINMAARFCDEIVALHSGQVLTQGAVSDVFQESALKSIYGIEMPIADHTAGYAVAMPGELSPV
ncbi:MULTISPECIES: ABC transporter ATP-binding protein [unclassified Salinivibrio]|uniref:ABC transporter ATP-binding protein n=1 Tax=unclassified Salinivibrio TaxID=2636825 RepID=UPI00084C784C|nr:MULTISPECIES: ATP-binding cassette domain-containing protein [unclassified Salinivibrio]ODP99521.1 iron-hydroxamate transporter ATP-binding subunit [Salinivibrio sp. DV]OOF20712.1 iron-hydroxamate transporter ATP-binding subunit [Salinivibrio sp. IB574]